MASFRQILTSNEEELLRIFYVYHKKNKGSGDRAGKIAKDLRLRSAQLVCAIGFNHYIKNLTEILPAIGFENIEELLNERNEIYTTDIYKKISLDNVLTLYGYIRDYPDTVQMMQYLMATRLKNIEEKIEFTVNSTVIDKYKQEMKAIYLDGIADIEFAEKRLDKIDSGFRALINEVSIIIETKLIPAGDIFFRDTILPEEKRKILKTGMIPDDLIQARLDDERIPSREKKMLEDYLAANKQNNN